MRLLAFEVPRARRGWKLSSLDRSRGLFQNFGPIALCEEFLGMDPANGCRVMSTLMHEEARGWCEVAESRKSHIMLGNVDTQRQ